MQKRLNSFANISMQQLIDMFFKVFLGESNWQKFTLGDHQEGLETYVILHNRSVDYVDID